MEAAIGHRRTGSELSAQPLEYLRHVGQLPLELNLSTTASPSRCLVCFLFPQLLSFTQPHILCHHYNTVTLNTLKPISILLYSPVYCIIPICFALPAHPIHHFSPRIGLGRAPSIHEPSRTLRQFFPLPFRDDDAHGFLLLEHIVYNLLF